MINNKIIYVVIPARGGSKRLPGKNIYPMWGKPMLYWAIRAAKECEYIDEVYVSTENETISEIATVCEAKVVDRPEELAGHHVFKQDVIVHAVETFRNKPNIVISLQPNSPQITSIDLKKAIEKFISFDRNEIFTVNEDLIQNAAFRVMKYEYVFQKSISTRCGVYVTDYVDVHSVDDVKYLEDNFSRPGE